MHHCRTVQLERRNSHASSSHEPPLKPTPARSVDLCKHSIKTHFLKDRNYEICQRTKITRAPCRRRNGGAAPRAENFGDLITADYKVLSENCESRNNHRYAVVVQDLATQWIQAYPCKTKTSQETQRSLQKFLEPDRKPKVIYTDNSLEFGKACEDLFWNHCTSTPHRSETNGIAERAERRVKEGTSAVSLRSGLNESWWADSMGCYTYLRNVQHLLSDGKTPCERRFGQPFKGPIIPFGSLVEYHPKTSIHQFGKKVLPGLFFGYALYAGGIWKGDVLVADVKELEWAFILSALRLTIELLHARPRLAKDLRNPNGSWTQLHSFSRSLPSGKKNFLFPPRPRAQRMPLILFVVWTVMTHLMKYRKTTNRKLPLGCFWTNSINKTLLGLSSRASRASGPISRHRDADILLHMKLVSRASRPGLLVCFLLIPCNGLCTAQRFHTEEHDHTCRVGCPDEPNSLTHCNECPCFMTSLFLSGDMLRYCHEEIIFYTT